jgi:hypothetical protein
MMFHLFKLCTRRYRETCQKHTIYNLPLCGLYVLKMKPNCDDRAYTNDVISVDGYYYFPAISYS